MTVSTLGFRVVTALAVAGAVAFRIGGPTGLLVRALASGLLTAAVMLVLSWIEARGRKSEALAAGPLTRVVLTLASGILLVLVIPLDQLHRGSLRDTFVLLCDVWALGTVCFIATRGAVIARPARHSPPGKAFGVMTAAICIATWSVVLAAKWPGIMTPDSIDQWKQIHTGIFSDHHPLTHTLWEWLVTRFWDSPGALALAQSLVLAILLGWVVSELARWGVPSWSLIAFAVVAACSPANTAYSVTLWKDVMYGAAMFGLVVCLLRILRTRGRSLASWTFLVMFVLLEVATATFRHNGPPVALVVLLGLPLAAREAGRRRIALAVGTTLLAFLLVRFGVPRLVMVQEGASELVTQIELHQIGAAVAGGSLPATPAERASLDSLLPEGEWKRAYNCFTGDSIIFNPALNRPLALAPRSPVPELWRAAVLRAPELIARHQLCVASMVWRITRDPSGYIYLYQRNTVPNELGLSTENPFPALERRIAAYWQFTADPGRSPFFWGPALYLYLTLWGVGVLAARLREPALLLLALPSLVQSAVLLLANVAQDARYQYPVYLIGLFVPVLLLVPRNEGRSTGDS